MPQIAASSHTGTGLIDTAQVISSTPIVERVSEPRQECSPMAAPAPQRERNIAGPIVGGVAGAILGAQVGRGSGQNAAAATSAVIGTVAGDRVQNPQQAAPAPAQQCRTVYSQRDVVRSYTVVYRYNGRDITTTLPKHPGPTVRVAVGVVDDNAPAATSPQPAMMGSNGRGAPLPVSDLPPPPPGNAPGIYQYRY